LHPSAADRRRHVCRVLVAAAGYGKTTALRRWYPPAAAYWHRGTGLDCPDTAAKELPRLVCDAVHGGARQIVVDDTPPLPPEAVRALVEAIGELPGPVSVVLSGRWPVAAAPVRWLGRGLWSELGPADLALSAEEVAELLADEYRLSDVDLAERLHDATGGWPALVHLGAQTLRLAGVPAGPLLPAIAAPGGPLAEYLAGEVVAALPATAVRLLRQVADLAPVSGELGRALGHRRADEAVRLLTRTGLVVGERVVPVLAEVVRRGGRPVPRATAARTLAAAAAFFDVNGPPIAAARAFQRAGDHARCARVLDDHGDALLATGHPAAVVELVDALPDPLRTRRLRLLRGDALLVVGDLDAAARAYAAVAATGSVPDAALAWRTGRVHYQRGDARAALAAFAAATPGADGAAPGADGAAPGADGAGPDADGAFLVAHTAHAHLLAGDVEQATATARRAVALATAAGHDGALATAHVALALCLGVAGDRAGSEEQYALALPIARRIGDVVLLGRLFTNRTYHLLCTARYGDALASAHESARCAAAAGSPHLRAIATSNKADALSMLGRHDEAVRKYEAVLAMYQRMGSRRVAGVHLGLGEVYRRRGWREQARAAYEEAVRVAEPAGFASALVPALAGLAMVLIGDDDVAAAACADRADDGAPALLARGWVAVARADRNAATDLAARAAGSARAQHDRAGLADALELRAAAEPDPARARECLREAYGIWAEAGATVEAARIQVLLARLPGAGTEDRLNGLVGAEHLAAAGALVDRVRIAAGGEAMPGDPVAIRAFGRFEVHVAGRPVPASGWQSRKARDLLRILVARRGRPVPRGELCELLWPDDDPDRTGHRLSVLLSIVRGVLDPGKANATDHYLVADQTSIALDITRVRVDVEEFLAHVAQGRRLVDRGAAAEARTLLTAVERQYTADAFADEPYADWSRPMREEARAAYLSVLRMLAQVTRAASGPGAAVGLLLRLLEHDPYDEYAHRSLVHAFVAGGQHGEARRAFGRYRDAMREIGVRPGPIGPAAPADH
jgi:DNA-binding SARP family transcriptional activator/tetratricopeptide (TPR) repeat protein